MIKTLYEDYNGRELNYTIKGITGTRKFKVQKGHEGLLPQIGEPYPGEGRIKVQSINLSSFGVAIPGTGAEGWQAVVNYSSAQAIEERDKLGLINEQIDIGGKAFTRQVKDGAAKWKGCNHPVSKDEQVPYGLWVPQIQYKATIHVTEESWQRWMKTLKNASNHVNNAFWNGGKKETWLFQGASSSSFNNSSGKRRYKVVLSFTWNEAGWNKAYHARCDKPKPRFEEIVFPEEPKKLYESTNFSKLLTFRRSNRRFFNSIVERIRP
jgi:hypothetical protein